MVFYMHAGQYKPQGVFKSVKYDPLRAALQCFRYNKWLHGNLSACATALEKRYGFGILKKLDWRAKLYFGCTIPKLHILPKRGKEGHRRIFQGVRGGAAEGGERKEGRLTVVSFSNFQKLFATLFRLRDLTNGLIVGIPDPSEVLVTTRVRKGDKACFLLRSGSQHFSLWSASSFSCRSVSCDIFEISLIFSTVARKTRLSYPSGVTPGGHLLSCSLCFFAFHPLSPPSLAGLGRHPTIKKTLRKSP